MRGVDASFVFSDSVVVTLHDSQIAVGNSCKCRAVDVGYIIAAKS